MKADCQREQPQSGETGTTLPYDSHRLTFSARHPGKHLTEPKKQLLGEGGCSTNAPRLTRVWGLRRKNVNEGQSVWYRTLEIWFGMV
jgi:hypothetical protein